MPTVPASSRTPLVVADSVHRLQPATPMCTGKRCDLTILATAPFLLLSLCVYNMPTVLVISRQRPSCRRRNHCSATSPPLPPLFFTVDFEGPGSGLLFPGPAAGLLNVDGNALRGPVDSTQRCPAVISGVHCWTSAVCVVMELLSGFPCPSLFHCPVLGPARGQHQDELQYVCTNLWFCVR